MDQESPTDLPLPYHDTKPVGAADFYFAINATYRFILEKFGIAGLHRYWRELGDSYFAPVSHRWRLGGAKAIASYWKAFFAAEPQSVVDVRLEGPSVEVAVTVCPAIRHLREHRREIVPCFCQQCYFINERIAQAAGYTVRVEGGNGTCRQSFLPANNLTPPQDLSAIAEVPC